MTIEYADLSEESPGMVLIYGPSGEQIFQHAPGNGYARHVLDTDAKLGEIGDMRPAGGVYNFALQAAAAKWLPTHRHGTITSIDRETDTCDLTLTACTLRGQNLNQSTTLSNVPVEYMTCDSAAFDLGDEVLIQFNTQDWNVPRVVGFKADPQPCPDGIILTVIEEYSGRIMTPENIGYIRIEGADTGSVLAIISDAANYWDEEKQFFAIPISPPTFPEGFEENYYISACFDDEGIFAANAVHTVYPRAWRRLQAGGISNILAPIDPDDYTGSAITAVPKGKYTLKAVRFSLNGVYNFTNGAYISGATMAFPNPGGTVEIRLTVESTIPFSSAAWFRETDTYLSGRYTWSVWTTKAEMIGDGDTCVNHGPTEAWAGSGKYHYNICGIISGTGEGWSTTPDGVIRVSQQHDCGQNQSSPIIVYATLSRVELANEIHPSSLALSVPSGTVICDSVWEFSQARTYDARIDAYITRD